MRRIYCGECRHWKPDVPVADWGHVPRAKVGFARLRLGRCEMQPDLRVEREELCRNGQAKLGVYRDKRTD